jgi:hypothetical protein
MHRKSLIVSSALALAFVIPALAGNGAPRMGPATSIQRKAFLGYYDGHKDTYFNTDVSSRAEAKMMHINFSPALAKAGNAAEEIYLVSGKAAVGQLAVFSSEPGEPTYSPLWHEMIVKWKPSATPELLVKDDQITELQKKGMLTVTKTNVVLNCPIVKVGKGAGS